ncbi:unnamed protein product [Brassica oleracea var. botrytis]
MGGDDESTFRTHHHDDTVDEAVESLGRQMSENGDLRVGMGVLATASHAVVIKTIFLVFYKPRISQFIVGVQQDELTTVQRPDRVSPWEIDPFLPSSPVLTPAQQSQPKCKRSRPVESSVLFSNVVRKMSLFSSLFLDDIDCVIS